MPMHILVVDDTEEDFMLLTYACASLEPVPKFSWIKDGAEALEYLDGVPPDPSHSPHVPFPDLMLLDLKMPRLDGFEVLAWMQKHPKQRVVPTIVYSSSSLQADVTRAYQLGASAFLTKPNSLDELQQIVKALHQFWALCERPEHPQTMQPARNGPPRTVHPERSIPRTR